MSKKIQLSSQIRTKTPKKSQNTRVSKQNSQQYKQNSQQYKQNSQQYKQNSQQSKQNSSKLAPKPNKKSKAKGKVLLSKPQTFDSRANLDSPKLQTLDSVDLAALTKSWYKALEDSGFKDIETFDNNMQPRAMLNGMSLRSLGNKEHWQKTFHFYARLRNYLTFNPNWSKNKAHRLIAEMYTEGVSYRDIVKAMKKARFRKGTNIWNVCKVVHLFVRLATRWNKTSNNGHDYKSDIG